MKDKRIRVLVRHGDDCGIGDAGCTSMVNLENANLDAAGGHRGTGYRWHKFICNDPDCYATVLVRDDVLSGIVSGWMEAPADA